MHDEREKLQALGFFSVEQETGSSAQNKVLSKERNQIGRITDSKWEENQRKYSETE